MPGAVVSQTTYPPVFSPLRCRPAYARYNSPIRRMTSLELRRFRSSVPFAVERQIGKRLVPAITDVASVVTGVIQRQFPRPR